MYNEILEFKKSFYLRLFLIIPSDLSKNLMHSTELTS